jgi:hypothetical protein
MKIYKTLIEGKNCWANFDRKTRRLGFFTARVAHGHNATQAEKIIRQKLNEDLHSLLLNKQDDPPKIIVNELAEIDQETASGILNAGAPGTQKTSPPASHPLGLINFPKGLGHGSVPDLALKGLRSMQASVWR